jgi:hypothetical protein
VKRAEEVKRGERALRSAPRRAAPCTHADAVARGGWVPARGNTYDAHAGTPHASRGALSRLAAPRDTTGRSAVRRPERLHAHAGAVAPQARSHGLAPLAGSANGRGSHTAVTTDHLTRFYSVVKTLFNCHSSRVQLCSLRTRGHQRRRQGPARSRTPRARVGRAASSSLVIAAHTARAPLETARAQRRPAPAPARTPTS